MLFRLTFSLFLLNKKKSSSSWELFFKCLEGVYKRKKIGVGVPFLSSPTPVTEPDLSCLMLTADMVAMELGRLRGVQVEVEQEEETEEP